jgi:FlgD Ig-like domain
MFPRDLIQRSGPLPRRIFACVFTLTSVLFLAGPAVGSVSTVSGVSVSPAAPTACDSVTLTMKGTLTNSCQQIVGDQRIGPDPIPEWVGPLPAYRTLLIVTVQQVLPQGGCAEVVTAYTREFPMPLLPIGQHFVTAVERVVDGNGALIDSSTANLSFTVAGADTCWPCVLLGFAAPPPGNPVGCDAAALPGGSACFDVFLGNNIPVGAAQFRIQVTDDQGQPLPAGSFTPVSVSRLDRVGGMEMQWAADGSATGVILYSTGTGSIGQGQGPVLRVCYSVGPDVPQGAYRIVFEKSIVLDVHGRTLGLCPTFRMISGRFCVGSTSGCDVNEDGIADVNDIVAIVRCALAGDACAPAVAGRSDCNGDGAVDVRDVICCVRKLLQLQVHAVSAPSDYSAAHTSLAFSGAARWISPLSGEASMDVTPVSQFGATVFDVIAPGGIRITSLDLSGGPGYHLEWADRGGGTVRALLLREGSAPVGPARITLGFERTGAGDLAGAALRIQNAWGSTWYATPTIIETPVDRAPVAAQAIPAPTVYRARPNPFSGATEIAFAVPEAGRVSLRVYDAAGRLVRTLVDGPREAGVARVSWDGRDQAGRGARSGIYFVRLSAAGAERSVRIVKLR